MVEFEIERQTKLLQEGKLIQSEVRKAEDDFTTSFLRPMPGASRLYPETDVMPFVPAKDVQVPKTIGEISLGLQKKYNVQEEVCLQLVKKDLSEFFERMAEKNKNVSPGFIAECIISLPKEIRRKHNVDVEGLPLEKWEELFLLMNLGKLPKGAIAEAVMEMAQGTFKIDKYQIVNDEEIEKAVSLALQETPSITAGALIGKIMGQFKGKADGKRVNVLIQKKLKEKSLKLENG